MKNDIWKLIVVNNSELMLKDSLKKFFVNFQEDFEIFPILVSDVVGTHRSRFIDGGNVQFADWSAFINFMSEFIQLEWANIYFGTESLTLDSPYLDLMKACQVTVRVVDNTYFYIYTQNAVLISNILSVYPTAECKEAMLEELDYPE